MLVCVCVAAKDEMEALRREDSVRFEAIVTNKGTRMKGSFSACDLRK